LNERTEGDWAGEFTYVGTRGNTVINYAVISKEINIRIKSFRIGERVDSDHLPLELEIAEKKRRRQEKRTGRAEEGKIEGKRMRIVWDKVAIQEFRERTEELCV